MSGVTTGSRLSQLQALARRTQHEIAAAFRREDRIELARLQRLAARLDEEITALGAPPVRPSVPALRRGPRRKADDRVSKHLERLGVTAHDVKAWALRQGLVDRINRGRIKAELVTAYDAAHPSTQRRQP